MTTRHRLCSIATFASLGVICSFVNAAPAGAQAVDPLGDFLPTYLGVQGGDLDVLSTGATYDGNNFLFTATLNGVVGTTTGGFYVWGVNRGTGTAGFSSLGLDGVLFDSVVIVRPNGASQVIVGGVPTTLGSGINFSGNTLSALVSGSLLPSTGFAPSQYTINLWPRTASTLSNGAVGGNAAISDFAPNNSNVLVTTTAPEPGSLTLAMLGGLTVAGTILRRRRA